MKDALTLTVNNLLKGDFTENLVTACIEQDMYTCFDYLDQLDKVKDLEDYQWSDYADSITHIRACINILQWYTVDKWDEALIRVNKHSLKFGELY